MKRALLPISPILALLALPAAASAAPAASATGSLSVTVAGTPKKAKNARRTVTVRAIDVRSGMLALAATSKQANPTIKLAPGAYVVAVRTVDFPGTASEGVSGIAVVRAGKKAKKQLRVKPLKKKKKAKKKAKKSLAFSAKKSKKSLWAPDSEYAGLRVIGVDPRLTLKGLDEYPSGLEIDSVVSVPLTQGCEGDQPKVRVVEIRRRAEIIEEIDCGDDPRFDKSKAVERGHLMKERELVKGSALIADGKISVSLRLVNVATGEVTAAGAAVGDGKSVDGIFATIDAAVEVLKEGLCGGKVDVTFTGSNSYSRDEGTAATDSQDSVRADYSWSTTYRGVNIGGDGTLNFASANSVTGSWQTDGRYGAQGPGNYHCQAPVKSYSGDFAMLRVKSTAGLAQLTIDPFLSVQGDHEQTSCTGLPGPPFASFAALGAAAPNQANVEFSVADLSAAGTLTFGVGPKVALAANCSDMPQDYELPCTQSQNWSGTVTVARAK